MSTAEQAVRDDEANVLFRGLEDARGLILAVSGGPDSTALMVLAARWAKRLKRAPKLVAVTVDHGLRAEAAREAAAVKRLAKDLGVAHRTLHWRGRKPKSGLQEAARIARYRLLGGHRGARRIRPYPDRAYARRSGGDDSVPSCARQRPRRSCRHGACFAAAARRADFAFPGASAASSAESAAGGDAGGGAHRLSATIRATAIRVSRGRGCAA